MGHGLRRSESDSDGVSVVVAMDLQKVICVFCIYG